MITYQNQTPGMLTSEVERLGKITVGTDLGWDRVVNPEGVRCERQGVLAAAVRGAKVDEACLERVPAAPWRVRAPWRSAPHAA